MVQTAELDELLPAGTRILVNPSEVSQHTANMSQYSRSFGRGGISFELVRIIAGVA